MCFYVSVKFQITDIYSVCLSVLKHASAKYATNAFSSKKNYEKLPLQYTFSKQHIIWSFHVAVLQRTAKKCTKIYDARAQPLFCSLNLLFGDVPVAVAVVVSLSSLIRIYDGDGGDHA